MKRRQTLLSFALAAATLLVVGFDEAVQTVSSKGVSFDVPKTWKSTISQKQMRAAEISVVAAEGDKEPTELIVFNFPSSPGSLQANLDRWEKMFVDKDGKSPKISTEKRKGKNVDVTFVETAGRYVAPVSPGSAEKHNEDGFRMLIAFVDAPRGSYSFRMVGPEKTVKSAKPAFEAMIKTIAVGEK